MTYQRCFWEDRTIVPDYWIGRFKVFTDFFNNGRSHNTSPFFGLVNIIIINKIHLSNVHPIIHTSLDSRDVSRILKNYSVLWKPFIHGFVLALWLSDLLITKFRNLQCKQYSLYHFGPTIRMLQYRRCSLFCDIYQSFELRWSETLCASLGLSAVSSLVGVDGVRCMSTLQHGAEIYLAWINSIGYDESEM